MVRALGVLAVVLVGAVIGTQYLSPDKRMLAVLAAAVIFGVAWRLDTVTGLGLLIVAIPYQRGTVFGSTTFAFILLLLLLWLLRVGQRRNPPLRSTPLDVPIAGLLIAYAISFYNIRDLTSFGFALNNTELFVAAVVLFYMLVSNIRNDADLARLQNFQAVSILTITLLAVYELNHPGGVFIPGWIEFTATVGTELNSKNVRVGGPFFDFELLSEFCAVNTLLLWFLILRARSFYGRVALIGLLILDVFVLFATITRGSIIALAIGIAYLAYRMRRQLKVVPVALTAVGLASAAIAMNFYVGHFTRSGSVGARLQETRFIGLIPDDRLGAWTDAWNRFLLHPIIGHGPYYAPRVDIHFTAWPHDIFLYVANLVGIVGLVFFVLILVQIFRFTRTSHLDLHDPSHSRAFLPVAHTMFAVFLIDEIKIDYLRNGIYQFEVWIFFAMLVAASRLASARPVQVPSPMPVPAAAA
ncbi:MAG: O-antigen ligase family protein [Candidatus Eiseniibacteriota bacterium]